MEVEEQGIGLLSHEDFLLVEHLTGELISKALDLCDEKVNSFDEIVESGIDLPPGGDRSVEDLAEETRSSSKKKKLKFSSAENCLLRSNSVDVSLTFSQTLNPGDDYVTPSWRRSLRRTQSEAALSQVDEGVEVEYLEHFDPFKGSLDLVSDVDEVLATSANKHPAEQTSFLQALEELSGKPCISCKMTDEKSNSVCFDCAESDDVDDTDDVDGGFACKTPVVAGREDDLVDGVKSQEPLFTTSVVAGIHNNDEPDSCSAGWRNDTESCSADTDVESRGSLNFENSIERTNDRSGNDTKLCMQSFNEDDILSSASVNMADSDHRNNIFIATSVIEEDTPPSHANDRVTNDTNDRVTDDTSDKVTDDTSDRRTDDTSDKRTDDTSDTVTDDTGDKVTDDTDDRVTDYTNDRVTDDANDKVTDDTSDRVTGDTSDRVTVDSNDRVTDDTGERVTDDMNDRVTDDMNFKVTDDVNYKVTDDASDRVTDDTNDIVTDDTSDRVKDDTNDRVKDDTNDRVTDDTSDKVTDTSNRLTDDSCIVGSISPSSLLHVQATEDSSTCNCMTPKNLKSDEDNFSDQCISPKPACAHVALNSVISDTEGVTKTDGRSDPKAADTKQVQPVNLDDTVSDVDGLANSSFLSTDTEADFSSFSAAEKFVREILSRSRSSSTSTSSPRKSCGAAINADSRMYNTLTFLDNDDSDDGEGGTDRDRISDRDRKNKTTSEATDGKETLDNHKRPASDVNDNPPSETAAVQPNDSEPTAAKKKIVPNLELLTCEDLDLNFSPRGSVPDLHLGDYYNDHTPDDLDSPDDLANPVFDSIDDWTDDLNDPPVEPIPEYTAREEYEDVRNWRPVQIAGISYRIDMRAIEPYKKVLSHGGYYGNGLNAIVVFAACYLPDRSRLDYRYIMDNLFLYVVSVLELLVVEDYMIIYFHAATSRNKVPALRWLKRCYDMIDHRLRKNLQRLLVVHPTFFLKTVVLMTKPFISSKFSSKLHYVRSLGELTRLVPTEYIHLPEEVKEVDRSLNPNTPAPRKKFINL